MIIQNEGIKLKMSCFAEYFQVLLCSHIGFIKLQMILFKRLMYVFAYFFLSLELD